MRNSINCLLGMVLLLHLSAASAEKFNLTTDSFQLGAWEPKKISYQQGLNKLNILDRWFYSLSNEERTKHIEDYALNRNRLFLVTQQKRLLDELQPTVRQKLLGKDSANKSILNEKSRQLAALRKFSDQLLPKPDLLGRVVFSKLADVESAVTEDGGARRAFSESVSKQTSGNWISHQLDFGMNANRDARESRLNRIKNVLALSEPVCSSMAVPATSLADELDPKNQPQSSQILKELGISTVPTTLKSNDLSNWYGEPTRQWDEKAGANKASCVGHAIAANLGAALYKQNMVKHQTFNKAKNISPDRTYQLAKDVQAADAALGQETIAGPDSKGYCDVQAYEADPYEGIQSMMKTLKAFQTLPLCASSAAQATQERFRVEKFSAAEFKKDAPKPGFAFFKAMIDSGNPPIVAVDSDARDESAGWFRIKSGGIYTHVFNVVGYSEGIDPATLCPTKFFIVRDSMGKNKVHYKVPAANLLDHLDGVYHISKARIDDRPTTEATAKKSPSKASPVAR